jgi:hypothetical protein
MAGAVGSEAPAVPGAAGCGSPPFLMSALDWPRFIPTLCLDRGQHSSPRVLRSTWAASAALPFCRNGRGAGCRVAGAGCLSMAPLPSHSQKRVVQHSGVSSADRPTAQVRCCGRREQGLGDDNGVFVGLIAEQAFGPDKRLLLGHGYSVRQLHHLSHLLGFGHPQRHRPLVQGLDHCRPVDPGILCLSDDARRASANSSCAMGASMRPASGCAALCSRRWPCARRSGSRPQAPCLLTDVS